MVWSKGVFAGEGHDQLKSHEVSKSLNRWIDWLTILILGEEKFALSSSQKRYAG